MTKTHCFWRPFNFFLSMLKLIAKSLPSREYLKCPVLILRPYRESSLKFEFRPPNSQVPPFLSLWHPQVFRAALTPPAACSKTQMLQKCVWVLGNFFGTPAESKQQDRFETTHRETSDIQGKELYEGSLQHTP